ncbi:MULTISPECIES: NrsF family protein [Bradyrhizobium]|uniref:NrsF family protein n=1 Tax=Bradyrhizobium elkanii TaxID=29448 RepID=UPI000488B730|nr:NrsF family protein [Bradyrhizobium elkanii]
MTTEELIRGLVADRHVEPRVDRHLNVSLLSGTLLVTLICFSAIGFRQDIVSALGTVRFLFKFAVVVPLAVFAVGATLRRATPGSDFGWWGRLLPVPAIILAFGVLAELMAVPASQWMVRLIGSNSLNCMTIIPLLGAGPLVMIIVALRQGAPTNAGLSGALAGLAASGIAATFYATNCFDDSHLFVVTWYPLAGTILVISGYLSGRRYLRW